MIFPFPKLRNQLRTPRHWRWWGSVCHWPLQEIRNKRNKSDFEYLQSYNQLDFWSNSAVRQIDFGSIPTISRHMQMKNIKTASASANSQNYTAQQGPKCSIQVSHKHKIWFVVRLLLVYTFIALMPKNVKNAHHPNWSHKKVDCVEGPCWWSWHKNSGNNWDIYAPDSNATDSSQLHLRLSIVAKSFSMTVWRYFWTACKTTSFLDAMLSCLASFE